MSGNKEQQIGVKHNWANIIYPMIHESDDGVTFKLVNSQGEPVTFDPQPNPEIDAKELIFDQLFAQAQQQVQVQVQVQLPQTLPQLPQTLPQLPQVQLPQTLPQLPQVQPQLPQLPAAARMKLPVRLPQPSSS
jgi:hypothetical protein